MLSRHVSRERRRLCQRSCAPIKHTPTLSCASWPVSSSSGTACRSLGIPTPPPPGAPPFVVYVGGGLELVAGALVMLRLFTRWAAFIASGQMAVAYWLAHGTRALPPLHNQGELAGLYCFVFLFIAPHGPGRWSVDAGGGSA